MIQHSDPNHLNPLQAAEFAGRFGIPRAVFEDALRSDNPPPHVAFMDPTRPMFRVFHREDLRTWAASLTAPPVRTFGP